MQNSSDLLALCKTIVEYVKKGDPAKDVIEQSAYSEAELIYKLALFYTNQKSSGEMGLHRTDMTDMMMYRAMTYFVVATLHIYRADIPEDAPTHPEQFMRAYPALTDRIFDEARNLFGYEISHLQMCKGIWAYFLTGQSELMKW